MADPFAALMSASTAVANAMDGDAMGDGGARGGQNAVMMGDAMATAAAIAAGEYVKSVGGGGVSRRGVLFMGLVAVFIWIVVRFRETRLVSMSLHLN